MNRDVIAPRCNCGLRKKGNYSGSGNPLNRPQENNKEGLGKNHMGNGLGNEKNGPVSNIAVEPNKNSSYNNSNNNDGSKLMSFTMGLNRDTIVGTKRGPAEA